jgi:hypothetical protein
LAYHVDGSKTSAFIGALADELLDRAKCVDESTKVTQEDMLERFIPSINMLMQNLFGYDKAPSGNGGGKRQTFFNSANPVFRSIGKNIKSSIMGMLPVGVGMDVRELLNNVECNPEDYKAGKPCRMKIDLKEVLGFDFGLTAQKCFKNQPEKR